MRFAPNERRTASPASTRRFLSKSFSRRRGLSRTSSALRPGLSPASLRAGGQVKSLLMLASRPHRGGDCRAREAFTESFGAERRPASARFAAGFSPTSSGVPMRRPGSSPVFPAASRFNTIARGAFLLTFPQPIIAWRASRGAAPNAQSDRADWNPPTNAQGRSRPRPRHARKSSQWPTR